MEFADCQFTCAIVFVAMLMLGFLGKKTKKNLSFLRVSKPILTPCPTQSRRWKHVRLPPGHSNRSTFWSLSKRLPPRTKRITRRKMKPHGNYHLDPIALFLKKNNGCKNVAFLFCCVPLGLKLTKVKGKLIQIARLHRTPCPNTSDRRQCCNSSTIRDSRFVRSHTERIT